MSLSPSATVILGNLQYETQLADVSASLAVLPGVNSFEVSLPAGVRLEAVPGDTARLDLDGGEGGRTVLSGKLRTLRRGLLATRVTACDGGAELSGYRPCATYEKQNSKAIIRALASEIGLTTGSLELDMPLAAYVAHQGRTAAEHCAYLAQLAGTLATFDPDGKLNVLAPPDRPELALLYGREIVGAEMSEQPAPATRWYMIGNGPAGSVDAPEALRPGRRPLPENAAQPGKSALWNPAPLLRTPAAANTASQAAGKLAYSQTLRLRADCFLLPALRPGQVLEIQELPNNITVGPWLVVQVTHHFNPAAGGFTRFEARSAGSGRAGGGLLAALAGAVGGLL